jgi:hypothetical protein
MEGSRDYMLGFVQKERTVSFEKVFETCEDRIHAIFLFLSILELSQQKFMKLMVGQGMNNFIVEWNDHREEDLQAEGLVADDETISGGEPPNQLRKNNYAIFFFTQRRKENRTRRKELLCFFALSFASSRPLSSGERVREKFLQNPQQNRPLLFSDHNFQFFQESRRYRCTSLAVADLVGKYFYIGHTFMRMHNNIAAIGVAV